MAFLRDVADVLGTPHKRRELIRGIRVAAPFALWQKWHKPAPKDPVRPVLMFHLGRSGSTVLADQLAQHDQVTWAKEIVRKVYSPLQRMHLPLVQRVSLKRLIQDHLSEAQTPVLGFEVKPFHVSYIGDEMTQFAQDARSLGIRDVIILRRKNTLRKIASTFMAREKGSFHHQTGAKAELRKVSIDIDDVYIDGTNASLLRTLETFEKGIDAAHALFADCNILELSYEDDILPDPSKAYHAICEFLDLPPQDVSVRLGRTTPFGLSDMIENYDEVERTLQGTPFHWMVTND